VAESGCAVMDEPTRLVISKDAVSDLDEIWLFIALNSPQNADIFIDRIYDTCLLLKENPEMGRLRQELSPGLRSFSVGRYIIFYRLKNDIIEIVRILSGYRDIDIAF
jgi:toxin ParE1/3/4